ncbi:MAG: polyphosphate kinase 1 [Tissierellia bacterium]|nr:polyphosphate kinase 1 [Tissierellia bacterium]
MAITKIARNRELSWLAFNERVLKEAEDDLPPLEKLKFIAIFMSNLEEFYRVRVGSLREKDQFQPEALDNKTKWSPKRQIHEINLRTRTLFKEKDRIHKEVNGELAKEGIIEGQMEMISDKAKEDVKKYYKKMIEPILSPQIVDPSHPFPFLENNQLYIVLLLEKEKNTKLAFIHVPENIPDLYFVKEGEKVQYLRKENIIKYYCSELFHQYESSLPVIINITRNADLTPEEEFDVADEDFREIMKKILKKRKRLQAVRLVSDEQLSPKMEERLLPPLNLKKDQVFTLETAMKMDYAFDLSKYIDHGDKLLYPSFHPVSSRVFEKDRSYMEQIEEEDKLLIYPYDDINDFIRLLDEAGSDKRVLSIKITIYRLSKHSQIVSRLIRAAENGVDVTVLMELRARFDEQNNIDYSEELAKAGCRIIYGMPGYKVHSKICLITYRDQGKIQYISQFGTGNYNENTAKQYTDLSYMTSREDIGKDAVQFFQNMGIGELRGKYKVLATSPYGFKPQMMEEIDKEIAKGKEGFIFCKFNSLSDKDFIEKFYEAAKNGVNLQLIIRGICCLKPGFRNIEIRSIVGRYLEHSRVYLFGKDDPRIYISSADLMTRNTERRVEIAVPILDPRIKEEIIEYMDIQWNDRKKARVHLKNGDYQLIDGEMGEFSSQDHMMKQAEKHKNKA